MALRRLALIFMVGCTSAIEPSPVEQPPIDPWGSAALHPAVDLNPDPHIVEVNVEAVESSHTFPGMPATPVWTYIGTMPGPLIDANVGDELIVHFTNRLPEETTIHWHGMRVPNDMDGVMGVTPATMPGETRDYRFTIKDAGLFWFHPHFRSDEQVNKGLYGVIRVRGPSEPVVDHEGVVVLDDIGLLKNGTIPTYLDDESKMMGRGGDRLLFNGVVHAAPTWRAGAIERLRFVNAANGRFFLLRLEGSSFRVIGTDGGLIPHPYDTERILVPPGKRIDVLVIPHGAPGTTTVLWNDPYDRGHDSGQDAASPVATFTISTDAPIEGRQLPGSFPALERLPDGDTDHVIELNEQLSAEGETLFTINGQTMMDVPPIDIPFGDIRRFEVKNLSEMDHPFHLHGFFFQVLARNGVALGNDALANEDTVVVPAKSSFRFVARFDETGSWPYHCHILEHAEAGMMGLIKVGSQ